MCGSVWDEHCSSHTSPLQLPQGCSASSSWGMILGSGVPGVLARAAGLCQPQDTAGLPARRGAGLVSLSPSRDSFREVWGRVLCHGSTGKLEISHVCTGRL